MYCIFFFLNYEHEFFISANRTSYILGCTSVKVCNNVLIFGVREIVFNVLTVEPHGNYSSIDYRVDKLF